ncbi:MAG: S8 family peptidase [Flavobacteriales bacterium]|jgi:serine protease AprX|nr:S8 family peptidase [Flavobacteriales bacterium]
MGNDRLLRFLRVALIFLSVPLRSFYAQTAPGTYLIEFTDKNGTPYSLNQPEAYLSPRALDRRARQSIAVDPTDLPVDPAYVSALLAAGNIQLVGTSRWQNSATIRTTDTLALDTLAQLPFVQNLRCLHDGTVRPGRVRSKWPEELRNSVDAPYEQHYGRGFRQLSMINGHLLHEAGARGEGILLGILDSGFDNADILPAFAPLRARNGIVLTADLVTGDGNVYQDHWHGRSVLSIIVAQLPGELVGAAPNVNVALVRTEDAATEYIVEEDNWVRGAEILDSLGCDVLNTSLGYTQFDDSTQDHSATDLDGLTTRISIASGMAAKKGMIVVNSAGNSGQSDWYRISAPADALGILAVGAVGSLRESAPFSGHGPSADGRVKPDVCAMGWGTAGLDIDGIHIAAINGTSFSAPLVAGGVACLWQLHPDRSAADVMAAVRGSASHHAHPDVDFGYGIPDLWRAHLLLDGDDRTDLTEVEFYNVMPVPFADHFEVELFTGAEDLLQVDLFDMLGRPVWAIQEHLDNRTYQRIWIADARLANLAAGPYVLRLRMGDRTQQRHVLKSLR